MPFDATPQIENDIVIRVFTRCNELLRRGWCKSVLAKTKHGNSIGPHSPNAASWCVVGALHRSCYEFDITVLPMLLLLEKAAGPPQLPALINDNARNVEDVLWLYHKVIDLRRRKLAEESYKCSVTS